MTNKMTETEKKVFRFNNQRVMLTYATHLDKLEYIDWIKSIGNLDVNWIRLAHETGESDYKHTHVLIEFKKAFQTRNERFFDYENLHPNIKFLKNKKAFRDAQLYIGKEDKDNEDLINKPCIIDAVLNENNIIEALKKNAKKYSDAQGIIAIHNLKKLDIRKNKLENRQLRGWQEIIRCELVNNEPDDRTVIWICDEEGGAGKSFFGRWMEDNYGNDFIMVDDLGTTRDAATIIRNAIIAGWNTKGIFINLSRSAEQHDRIYNYLEMLKDGNITTQKYSGNRCLFDSPHVVVFANFLPKIYNLSLDRWKIFEIKNESIIDSTKKTISKAEKQAEAWSDWDTPSEM